MTIPVEYVIMNMYKHIRPKLRLNVQFYREILLTAVVQKTGLSAGTKNGFRGHKLCAVLQLKQFTQTLQHKLDLSKETPNG